MNRALLIVALQNLEDELGGLQSQLATVEQEIADDAALLEANTALEAAVVGARATLSEQKRIESEVARLDAKIETEEKRLYDGSVKIPKELQSIQAEIDGLKRQKAGFEEQLLTAISEAEAAESVRSAAAETASDEATRREVALPPLQRQATALAGLIAASQKNVNAHRATIPPADLNLFDGLRRRKSGVAVAKISGSTCAGCRISIPDAMRRRSMSTTQLAQCPNCERILYLG